MKSLKYKQKEEKVEGACGALLLLKPKVGHPSSLLVMLLTYAALYKNVKHMATGHWGMASKCISVRSMDSTTHLVVSEKASRIDLCIIDHTG